MLAKLRARRRAARHKHLDGLAKLTAIFLRQADDIERLLQRFNPQIKPPSRDMMMALVGALRRASDCSAGGDMGAITQHLALAAEWADRLAQVRGIAMLRAGFDLRQIFENNARGWRHLARSCARVDKKLRNPFSLARARLFLASLRGPDEFRRATEKLAGLS